ncbi:MAG: PilZ domain-containing protein [Leptospirillia bacterium]
MSIDNRQHERYDMMLEVEVAWEGHGSVTATTRDVSDAGVFVEARFDVQPPLGTLMQTKVKATVDGGEPPVLTGKVVRTTPTGFALEFMRD